MSRPLYHKPHHKKVALERGCLDGKYLFSNAGFVVGLFNVIVPSLTTARTENLLSEASNLAKKCVKAGFRSVPQNFGNVSLSRRLWHARTSDILLGWIS